MDDSVFLSLKRIEQKGDVSSEKRELSSVIVLHSIGGYYKNICFILKDCIIIFSDLLTNLFQYLLSKFTSTKVALYFKNILLDLTVC